MLHEPSEREQVYVMFVPAPGEEKPELPLVSENTDRNDSTSNRPLDVEKAIGHERIITVTGAGDMCFNYWHVAYGLAYDAVTSVGNAVVVAVSSAAGIGAYRVLDTWVKARNGRKLKIKVGDIEVEATQMKEEDVLRIFELLEEKADRKKIREALIEAGKGGGRPEA